MKIPKWFDILHQHSSLHPAIDHIKVIKNKYISNRIEVHSRPYHIPQYQMEKIIEICNENSIHFEITGKTEYSNHDTLTIKFWKIKEVERRLTKWM